MNPALRFRNEWQMLRSIDRDRQKLLERDRKEVMHEMILQDVQEGMTHQQAADAYHVHKSTVWRIVARRK